MAHMGSRVHGVGFRVKVLEFGVSVQGLGLKVQLDVSVQASVVGVK